MHAAERRNEQCRGTQLQLRRSSKAAFRPHARDGGLLGCPGCEETDERVRLEPGSGACPDGNNAGEARFSALGIRTEDGRADYVHRGVPCFRPFTTAGEDCDLPLGRNLAGRRVQS